MERPDPSLNQQFNDQYDEVIETIQERAIWRVGERVTDLDQFRCVCSKCGYESRHVRFDIARHRLLFGKSIRQIEDPRPMVRCDRCGVQRHTRDIDELVVPTTQRLHAAVRDHLPPPGEGSSTLASPLRAALLAFREEASSPVCRTMVADIAADVTASDTAFIEAVGRELLLSSDEIADIVATLR